ncbi:cleavage and polyadenylation specificity factor subunit cg7185 [Phtheirospermum japonicum]|uniref:Cleavage and polyadenylation specificity factor subunit cg7185 n=1 Tax=Phtheirospermum japonicum TaxID=374723 RepID=A0A830D572_9LAMI|nr:cleavage and polyadenylation specificity factor subunit cg7185 [Phtheirospermum japonicum]
MDPAADEQLDYGDEEYGGNQKMQYHQGGAIPALAEEEMIGEDDEYDDLYNDVNVGEGFLQMQRTESQMPSGVENSGFQTSKNPDTRAEAIAPQEVNNARVANEIQFPEQKTSLPATVGPAQTVDASPKERLPEIAHASQPGHLGYQGSVNVAHKTAPDRMNNSEKMVGVQQIPPNLMNSNANVNMNRSMDEEYMIRPSAENGNTMLFVGELHWWTTDAEIENVLIQYGKVKEIKFFDERASGKSKGYCQVEFYDAVAASACKEGMNGHIFNGRACVVAFATPQTIKQMGASYTNKNQAQAQPQQLQGRNPPNDGAGRGNGSNYSGGDPGRNFGRGGWGRGNQLNNRGGPMRGRGGMGNRPNAGGGGGGNYGQGLNGPGFGGPPGMIHPQGMMGPGFDLAFMGRGGAYGGFSGPGFPGMMPPYQGVSSMGLPGVAPHVNPAFFGRGMAPNGMGMMGNAGMGGHHSGMWNEANMGGWGGEEQHGGRESSYAGEDNASEYGYAEASHDKGVRSSAVSREKERNSERDWSSNPSEKRHREEREHDGERYERDSRYREEKDRYREYRHKDRDSGYDEDWDRGQSSRSRSRSGAVPEDDHRSRSRDADYGKRRRMPSE